MISDLKQSEFVDLNHRLHYFESSWLEVIPQLQHWGLSRISNENRRDVMCELPTRFFFFVPGLSHHLGPVWQIVFFLRSVCYILSLSPAIVMSSYTSAIGFTSFLSFLVFQHVKLFSICPIPSSSHGIWDVSLLFSWKWWYSRCSFNNNMHVHFWSYPSLSLRTSSSASSSHSLLALLLPSSCLNCKVVSRLIDTY